MLSSISEPANSLDSEIEADTINFSALGVWEEEVSKGGGVMEDDEAMATMLSR